MVFGPQITCWPDQSGVLAGGSHLSIHPSVQVIAWARPANQGAVRVASQVASRDVCQEFGFQIGARIWTFVMNYY